MKPLTEYQAERVLMELVQVYCQQRLPAGVIWRDGGILESHVDLVTQDLVLGLRAFVLGESGPTLEETHEWIEYRFPRYIPRWLRRRWSKVQTIHLTMKGKIVYPEQRIIDKLGPGSRVVELVDYSRRPPGIS